MVCRVKDVVSVTLVSVSVTYATIPLIPECTENGCEECQAAANVCDRCDAGHIPSIFGDMCIRTYYT